MCYCIVTKPPVFYKGALWGGGIFRKLSKAETKLPFFAAFISYFVKGNSTAIVEFLDKVLDNHSLATDILLRRTKLFCNFVLIISIAKHMKSCICYA